MNAQQFNDMSLDGMRTSGQDVRNQNVTAAQAISNVIKSSLGPVGLGELFRGLGPRTCQGRRGSRVCLCLREISFPVNRSSLFFTRYPLQSDLSFFDWWMSSRFLFARAIRTAASFMRCRLQKCFGRSKQL